ncbi:hypothetical protein LA080_015867 [Diaporthe eres]|nr:hypothetical protein LA080_015867 [Diaporthe eres]
MVNWMTSGVAHSVPTILRDQLDSDVTTWLINAWEDEASALGVDDDNLAVLVFFLYFAGRYLARFNITTFVATLLQRYDLELVGNPPFPKKDEGRPVLGTLCIKEGPDFKVGFSTRATET